MNARRPSVGAVVTRYGACRSWFIAAVMVSGFGLSAGACGPFRPPAADAGASATPLAEVDPVSLALATQRARQSLAYAYDSAALAAVPRPHEILMRVGLATALIDDHEYVAARRHMDWLIAVQPQSWTVWEQVARVRLQADRDLQGALGAADECLRLRSRIPGCLRVRGLALLELGREAEALASLEEALVAQPNDVQLIEQVARVRLSQGQAAGALALLDAAFLDGYDGLTLRLVAGAAAEAAGAIDAAHAHYQWIQREHRDPSIGARYLLQFYERQQWTEEAAELHEAIYGSAGPSRRRGSR